MKSQILILICSAFLWTGAFAQTNAATKKATMDISKPLPYYEIPDYPESYSSGNVLSRVVDGLGYRLYWATEGLRPEDLTFRPSEDAQSVAETMDHFYGLSLMILNSTTSTPNVRPLTIPEISFDEKRAFVLEHLKMASDNLKAATESDIAAMKVIFKRGEQQSAFSFWHSLNGPIADAIYHTGQIVSFRRTNGNPINAKVNVFTGKNRE